MSETTAIPRDEFFESLLGDFLDESGQLLDRLNENMLQLDEWFRSLDDAVSQGCNMELLNEMFRSAHSLKGLSAMLGLSDINHLTHKIENVFDAARKDELPLNCEVVDLMFQGIDRLVGMVETLKSPDREAVDCTDVLEGIHRILASAGVEKIVTSQADAENALSQLTTEGKMAAFDSSIENTEFQATPPVESRNDLVQFRENEAPGESQNGQTIAASNSVRQEPCPLEITKTCAETRSPEAKADYFAGIVDECDLQSKYVSIFIDETELSLDNLTEALLGLEQEGHRAAIEQLLMTSHRIKGSAASIGMNRAAKLAHLMEDLMQEFSSNDQSLTPKTIDALLDCIDGLRTYVDSLKTGHPHTEHFLPLAQALIDSQTVEESSSVDPTPDRIAMAAVDTAGAVSVAEQEDVLETPAIPPCEEKLQLRVLEKIKAGERESAMVGVVSFQPHLPLVGLKARLLYEKLANLGEIRYFSPPGEQLEEMEEIAFVEFGVVTEKPLERVKRTLQVAGVTKIDLEPLAAQPESPKADSMPLSIKSASVTPPVSNSEEILQGTVSANINAKKENRPAADNTSKPTETLRVDIERLDQLMNLAGQLVINKARFVQIGDKLKKAVGGRQSRNAFDNAASLLAKMAESSGSGSQHGLEILRSQIRRLQQDMEQIRHDVQSLATVRSSVNDLFETIHLLDRVADGIQQSVMDTRMLPIGPLFQRFKRVIRDISRDNGKNIRLEINGEKTELDKRMIDELGDPLIHMVRNSADHGIESPQDRLAAGKPEQGTVTLDAFHRGNSIYIRVVDDGKGLDSERIKTKALERGLITPVEAEHMTKSQIFQLIWEPGLSTAEKVTQVSGRGMGMDIVKSKIEGLNGTIELDSERGRGTTITIKLPLTLAILPSLMVSIDGDTFAMPLESVVEIVNVSPKDICTVQKQTTARVRGRVISMIELEEVFTWQGGKNNSDISDNEKENASSTLVIINENGRELGLVVDHVIGEQDIVIKSMAENYRNVQGVAGASILGDGRVSLILDLAAVIDMATCQKVEA